jgi:hypothetical protein
MSKPIYLYRGNQSLISYFCNLLIKRPTRCRLSAGLIYSVLLTQVLAGVVGYTINWDDCWLAMIAETITPVLLWLFACKKTQFISMRLDSGWFRAFAQAGSFVDTKVHLSSVFDVLGRI